jgi:hypothetical protein
MELAAGSALSLALIAARALGSGRKPSIAGRLRAQRLTPEALRSALFSRPAIEGLRHPQQPTAASRTPRHTQLAHRQAETAQHPALSHRR